jgi:hypothetical protein
MLTQCSVGGFELRTCRRRWAAPAIRLIHDDRERSDA